LQIADFKSQVADCRIQIAGFSAGVNRHFKVLVVKKRDARKEIGEKGRCRRTGGKEMCRKRGGHAWKGIRIG
jgi:cell fate regulator YaaT (PSP1 superfamily)